MLHLQLVALGRARRALLLSGPQPALRHVEHDPARLPRPGGGTVFDANLALVVLGPIALVLAVVVALHAARADARAQEARAGGAELDRERERRERAEERAARAEAHAQRLADAGRRYLALSPVGPGGAADRERLGVLLDLTEQAAGAGPPPAPGAPAADAPPPDRRVA